MTFLHKLAHRLARLRGRLAGVALTLLATALVGSCEKPVGITDSGTNEVAQFTVYPHTMTLRTGQTADFMAVALASTGDTVSVAVTWSATSGAIMDTSSKGGRHYGKYKAGSDTGKVTLIATGHPGNVSDTATVAVTLPPVSAVSVSPASASVQPGQTLQLTATTLDSAGNVLTGRTVTWSSSNTAAATVSRTGLVSGVAAGSATITALSEGQSGTAVVAVTNAPVASVIVTPLSATVSVGQTAQLTATLKDASGNVLSGRAVTWSSSDTTIARVSGSGVVTAVATGSATITATSEGQSGTSSVSVTPVSVASVAVTPASASVQVGQTVQFTATLKDASGNTLSGRVVTWVSSNTGVASVSSSGLATAKAAGTATITATSEGKSGTSTVTVTSVPVASVTVNPGSANLQVGQTVQLTATPKDATGNALSGRVVTWASGNSGVASVSGNGLVTAKAAGSATITATSEGQNGTAAITVTAPPPGSCVSVCHYVDAASGNDANAGTSAAPWRTIQHAADVTNPGDTVIVNDGVYTGGANVVTIGRSGTAAGWLVFRAAHLWGAVIDGQNNSSTTGFEINGNYIRVQGFEVRNTNRYGFDAYGGSESAAGNHDIDVLQNHIHDIGHICTGSVGGIVGVDAYSDNLTIERNVIHDIGRLGPGEQGCVEPNGNWQNHDHGVYNGIGDNVVIRNNLFYNFTHGFAIQRYNGNGAVTNGLTIVNNTFAFPNPWRDSHIIIATGVNNLLIANNIFYQPTTAAVWFDTGGLTNVTLSNNLSFGAAMSEGLSGMTSAGNLVNVDPGFVSVSGPDFHLQAGSPAIGAGMTLSSVPNDLDGYLRSGTAYTIGAYQYH